MGEARPIAFKRDSRISEPGLYAGVPIDVYHGAELCDGPSVSSSGLRTIYNESPAHYWCRSPYNPERVDEKETEAFTLGRAAHHLLLCEDAFSTLFTCRPEIWGDWRTKDSRAWRDEQIEAGRTVLIPSQLDQIRGMARSLAAHPLIASGILNGQIEQSMVWRCKETGLWIKSRPDAIPNSSGDFVDLKTTASVRTDDLMKSIADFGLHMQGALVCEGWHALTGETATSFTLAFVEKTPPHCVRVVTLRDEDLIRGERQNTIAKQTFARCMAEGYWPGPGENDAEYMGLPSWAQSRIDKQLEELEAA